VAQLVASDRSRREAPPGAPVGPVVAGMGAFARSVDRILARPAGAGAGAGAGAAVGVGVGNTVFSPLSIAAAFAMAWAGARGRTVDDIARVFGFPADGTHAAMNALAAALAGAASDEVVLDVANSLWVQDGFDVSPAFLDVLATDHGAGVWSTDFAGDPGGSVRAINGWVAERTRDRIPELLEGPIDPLGRVVLVNAVYLKAAWAAAFDPSATEDLPFHLAGGDAVPVPTMRAAALEAGHAAGDGYTAVSLPYAAGRLAMLVVVPDAGTTLDDLAAGLPPLEDVAGALTPASVDLALPRWESRAELDLAPVLGELGLRIPGGDMTGIAPDLELGSAVHAADITVDESGTEAAAATAIVVRTVAYRPPPPPVTVTVDRPFLYAVRHVPTGAPLFLGRVADPRSSTWRS
jgi:serpin B